VPQGLRPGSRMAAGVNCAWRWPVNLTESRSWSTAGLPMSRRLYGGWIADADKKGMARGRRSSRGLVGTFGGTPAPGFRGRQWLAGCEAQLGPDRRQ
jgi:hypothetical protein